MSKGGGSNSAPLAASALAAISSVRPSGGLSINALTAMFVPAPGLFSTITVSFDVAAICWPTLRASASTAPPAE